MAAKGVPKPYKLKPTGDALSRDDVSTWKQILLGYLRSTARFQKFLPPAGTRREWTASDEDEANGFTIDADNDENAVNQIRADFADFITSVATYCPAGFSDTVQRESTSFNWVVDLIESTFALNTKGEHFLALDD